MEHFVRIVKDGREGDICAVHAPNCLVLWADGVEPTLTLEPLDALDMAEPVPGQ